MTGEFSLPVTGMGGMWLTKTKLAQIGGTNFTGNSASNIQISPDPVEGYTPVGVVGYGTQNENANGVVPSGFQGHSWIMPITFMYDAQNQVCNIQYRNLSNTGSTGTVNKDGGSYVMCFIKVQFLYLKKSNSEYYVPKDPVTTANVQLNYGLSAYVTRYGRMCMVNINANVNQVVNAWANLGNLPKPKHQVIATNSAYNDHYMVLNYDGQLLVSTQLPKGWYVQMYFTYITAD